MSKLPLSRRRSVLSLRSRSLLDLERSRTTSMYNFGLHRYALPAYRLGDNSFYKLPEQMRMALMNLANHGWFLDFKMPVPRIWKLNVVFERGEVSEAEVILIEYFKNRLGEIRDELAAAYPHRTRFLVPAFAAHERGEYALAIPTFLAQANGICKEITSAELFTKRNGRAATSDYIESVEAETFLAAVLHPLTQRLPISTSQSERESRFVGLNRHTIMHGESLDYDSEINSLRAISFLNYVGDVLRRAAERKQRIAILRAAMEAGLVKSGDLVEDVIKRFSSQLAPLSIRSK